MGRRMRPVSLTMPLTMNKTDASTSGPVARFLLAGPLPPPEHGQSLMFEMLCGALRGRGYDCRIVNIQGKNPSSLGRLSLRRSIETLLSVGRFASGALSRYRRVYITVSRSRPGFMRDMAMICIARLRGCRVAIHVHGGNYDVFYRSQPRFWRFLIRHTLRRTQRILVLSERLRGMFDFDPTLKERIAVVANSLFFTPNAALRGRRLRPNRPVRLLFLSNLIQSKGYVEALEAVAILRRTTTIPLKAVFAGRFLASPDDPAPMPPKEAETRFHEYVAANRLENVVRYAGPVVGEEKRHLLETSDFFLLPTRYFTEGQPVSIIEAMAYGCVVIATDYRAIPDMVIDGVTGMLIDLGRPERIADAVRRIAAEPDRYAAMSRAAVERYEKYFTMQRHLDTIVPLLQCM